MKEKNNNKILFWRKNKQTLNALEEEAIQTPIRAIIKSFFSSKLSVAALITFMTIIIATFSLSAMFPLDTTYSEATQDHVSPGLSLMKYPSSYDATKQDISIGQTFSVSIDADGKPLVWGKPTTKLNEIPKDAKDLIAIAGGKDHISAITELGDIVVWGNTKYNNLDDVPVIERSHGKPVSVQASYQYSTLITSKGYLYVWGNKNFNKLDQKAIPKEIQGHVKHVVLTTSNAIILLDDGSVRVIGANETPITQVPEGLVNIVDIAATEATAMAITSEGRVIGWGQQRYNELNIPESIQGNVQKIESGNFHFLALSKDGKVYAWGRNTFGESSVPSSLSNGSKTVDKIYAGAYQNYAIEKDGTITTFGLKGYILGSDQLGRDIFRRLVSGGRVTLTVGVIAVVISTILAILFGSIAGFYGGKIDNLIMRFGEIISLLPTIPILIIISVIIGNQFPDHQRVMLVMAILGLISWPSFARLVRGTILSEREKEFVLSAKAMGIKEKNIIIRHIIPNIITLVIVYITLGYASYLLIETVLSFLGFGIIDPNASWGNMLNGTANPQILEIYWWRWIFPAIAVSITAISVNLVGDGLRNAIDPKSKER